jgi:hypothetical protein
VAKKISKKRGKSDKVASNQNGLSARSTAAAKKKLSNDTQSGTTKDGNKRNPKDNGAQVKNMPTSREGAIIDGTCQIRNRV